MQGTVPMSEEDFQKLALSDPSAGWELHCGVARQKPDMTFEHNYRGGRLAHLLDRQLDDHMYQVRQGVGHVRTTADRYYIPDVCVIPLELLRPYLGQSNLLEVYAAPLPLVVEIWSPSTGAYDVDTKLPQYQRRGDLEIWRIHPYDRTLTTWVRQPDGSYVESRYDHGVVHLSGLPGVTIDLDSLFD